jgi:predicted acylesterase/phospholipase RssA
MTPPAPPNLSKYSIREDFFREGGLGLVLSGGGSRTGYQVGVLQAFIPYLNLSPNGISVITGSSMGAVNGIALAGCLRSGLQNAVMEVGELWCERTFRNTFRGSPSRAFLKAIQVAILRYSTPGPVSTPHSIFDPTPLVERLNKTLDSHGGLSLENRDPQLKAVAVMTTLEGPTRRPLLFVSARAEDHVADNFRGATFDISLVDKLSAQHGLASAALPSLLPSVELDVDGGKVRLVDGGISENVPVDPTVRLGADRVIVIDVSGRSWWHDHYGQPYDTRPSWEVPSGAATFCLRPPETIIIKPRSGLGPVLRQAVSGSRRDFIAALGPTWPIFSILKRKLGEEIAFEVMSYVALHRDYTQALIEKGYEETRAHIEHALAHNLKAQTRESHPKTQTHS